MDKESDQPLLTMGDIAQWRNRLSAIDRELIKLSEERNELIELVDMATRLSQRARHFSANSRSEEIAHLHFDDVPVIREASKPFLTADMTFPDGVYNIVKNRPSGITTGQIRRELEASPLAERLRESDKGFYHATSRLRDQSREHHIVSYRGYFFTPENLRLFLERVKSGVEPDKVLEYLTRRGSPMTERIVEIVAENPGITAKAIVETLLDEKITANANSAFNTVSRMKKAKELIGDGKSERNLYLGPNARIDANSVFRNENKETKVSPDAAGTAASLE